MRASFQLTILYLSSGDCRFARDIRARFEKNQPSTGIEMLFSRSFLMPADSQADCLRRGDVWRQRAL